MTNVKYTYDVAFDREENSIDVRFAAVQELSNLHLKLSTFGRHGAAGGKHR